MKLFFCHKGVPNTPAASRQFKAFSSYMQLCEYQQDVWKQTGGNQNVVCCDEAFLLSVHPDYVIQGTDVYSSINALQTKFNYAANSTAARTATAIYPAAV